MKISELFDLQVGKPLELMSMTNYKPEINFVSRTGENNGVVGYVDALKDTEPYEKGLITVSLGGSVLSAFIQEERFYTSFHIMVLTPKKEMSLIEKFFYCYCISKNKYKYSYGRQANKTLKNIELPDEIPEWVYKVDLEDYYKTIKTNVSHRNLELHTSNWKEFDLVEFFNMFAGEYINKLDYEEGIVPYVSTSDVDNGVMSFVNISPKFPQNCITIGKVGVTTYYQNHPFLATSDVTVLVPKYDFLNKYIGLFISTLIKQESKKWTYGRQIRLGDCKELIIKFPVKNDVPDWSFMEYYIKQLPYSDKI